MGNSSCHLHPSVQYKNSSLVLFLSLYVCLLGFLRRASAVKAILWKAVGIQAAATPKKHLRFVSF